MPTRSDPAQSLLFAFADHPDHETEWWYVQGVVDSPKLGPVHLMASFHRVGPSRSPGHMVLQQAIYERSGVCIPKASLSPRFAEIQDEIARTFVLDRYPQPLAKPLYRLYKVAMARLMRETAIHILERDISASDSIVFGDGFELTCEGDSLTLKMSPDGVENSAALLLEPRAPWLTLDSASLNSEYGRVFQYVSCPRLNAKGIFGGEPVTGTFWFDHQWGDIAGWFLRRENQRLRFMGWTWFGLNLEDGRDLMVQLGRQEGGDHPVASFALLFADGKATHLGSDIHAKPTDYWTSPRTGARYPVAWSLSLPSHQLELTVEPLMPDQEIPIYGSGGIWEGVVSVLGNFKGLSVTGRGRLELFGYATVTTLGEYLRRHLTFLRPHSPFE